MQEKEPIGCTLIQDEYILFDKEGIVIGKSPIQPEKLLFIEGMQAEEVTVGEELPVPEKRIFRNIIEISNAFAQHSITTDRLVCSGANITAYIGGVCVEFGSSDMELKVDQLPDILTKLGEKSGTLDLRHYNDSTEIISFKEGELPKEAGE